MVIDAHSHLLQGRHPCSDLPQSLDDLSDVDVDELLTGLDKLGVEAVVTLAQEMARDDRVLLIGEDVAKAGGVFKTTAGLLEMFGPTRVRDTPISEEAITGMIMGAAMNGLRPVGELMFSDFLATCWDIVTNQIAKTRYMTGGQVELPLVIRTANGGGARFGGRAG